MHHPEPERWQRVLDEFTPDWLQTDAADFRRIDLPPHCIALPVYREGHTPFSRRKGDSERRDAGDAGGGNLRHPGPRSSADDSEDSVRTVSLRHALPPRLLFEGTQSGTGRASDWDEARALARATQLVLAGGLHSGNVAAAIVRVRPFGVDVSSGVERTRGRKDPAMIKEFVARVRALEVS
jgi:hypothetical protein